MTVVGRRSILRRHSHMCTRKGNRIQGQHGMGVRRKRRQIDSGACSLDVWAAIGRQLQRHWLGMILACACGQVAHTSEHWPSMGCHMQKPLSAGPAGAAVASIVFWLVLRYRLRDRTLKERVTEHEPLTVGSNCARGNNRSHSKTLEDKCCASGSCSRANAPGTRCGAPFVRQLGHLGLRPGPSRKRVELYCSCLRSETV
jgi:hypothetical protein